LDLGQRLSREEAERASGESTAESGVRGLSPASITSSMALSPGADAWRSLVIPQSEISDPLPHANCPARNQLLSPETENQQKKRPCRPRNYSWAQLMRRVFSLDALECPRCGGQMRILAAINPPLEAIHKILDCLGLPSRPPPTTRPEREIDELDFS
jgi:hypothetical protein